MGKKNKKKIEVEFRSVFEKEKYDELKKFISKNAFDLGEDDKDVSFFLLPDRIVKVVKNKSKRTASIVLKLNRLGRGRSDFEELEIPIKPENFDEAVKIFRNLNFDAVQNTFQKRHNYFYKGVNLALKYSQTWGYHLELDIVVDKESKKEDAERKIKEVADKLGVKIMSERELTRFARKIDQNYEKGSTKG